MSLKVTLLMGKVPAIRRQELNKKSLKTDFCELRFSSVPAVRAHSEEDTSPAVIGPKAPSKTLPHL